MQGPPVVDSNSFEIELSFNGRNLKDTDVFSKSDPFLKVFLLQNFYGKMESIGQTEQLQNTVNPNWNKKLTAQYFFEQQQPMRLQVYDSDGVTENDFIGKVQTTLGAVMGATHQTLILDLTDDNNKKAGKIIIRADKVENSSQALTMQWRGQKIKNVDSHFDFWDKSDPYLKFFKLRGDNSFVQVAKTEVVMDNQDPRWKPISIPLAKLIRTDNISGTFRVECWDYEQKDHKHQMIGYSFASLDMLKNLKGPTQFDMQNPDIKKPGSLVLQSISFDVIPNFVDYLQSGLQINMVAAIDFTGSNGNPTSPTSLHCLNNQPTQYQQVLRTIWSIIQNYDSDKLIPAFGFGAKITFPNIKTNQVTHCFPINDSPNNPNIQGFDNLNTCYVNALKNMQLSGPTYFVPIIKESLKHASRLQGKYAYSVLLILTDGEIHDMAETKNLIVENCGLPFSIVIVGIGNADFSKMQQLDGDGGLYSANGKKASRDVVQFVPFNNFKGNADLLARQLLKEIPDQVVQYFKSVGMPPKPIPPPQNK